MSKTEIMNKASRKLHKLGFKLKKHSPEILAVAGTVGVVTSTVLACRATTKLSGILEESNDYINKIHYYADNPQELSEEYTEQDAKKDLTIAYAQTGVRVAKLYAPSVALGVLSLTAILSSNHILRKRNIALAAAYTTIDKSFKEYRSRVVERFGADLDRELRYNIKAKEFEKTVVDSKGKEKTVKETVEVAELGKYSVYAKFFDDGCTGWTKNPDYNLTFLKQQQDYANEMLQSRGYLFLNEVYDMLGVPRTEAGQIVGWIYDEKTPLGDNFVDFGIYNTNIEKNRDFVNGYERTILLDFNVDGNILKYI